MPATTGELTTSLYKDTHTMSMSSFKKAAQSIARAPLSFSLLFPCTRKEQPRGHTSAAVGEQAGGSGADRARGLRSYVVGTHEVVTAAGGVP